MKKHFYGNPIWLTTITVSYLALIGGSIYSCIEYYHSLNILGFVLLAVALFFVMFFLGTFVVREITYHIDMDDCSISTKGHISFFEKVQYPTKIKYNDISEFKIIIKSINSKGEYITSKRANYYVFFEFTLKGDSKRNRKARLFINFLSKKQKEKIIAIIEEKTGLECQRSKREKSSEKSNGED